MNIFWRLSFLLFFLLKCLSTISRNLFPTFVVTEALNGGLKYMTFLFLVFFFVFSLFFVFVLSFSSLFSCFWNWSLLLNPLFFKAFWYSAIESLNISYFFEMLDSLFSIIFGSSFLMFSGWFESLCMYMILCMSPSENKNRSLDPKLVDS